MAHYYILLLVMINPFAQVLYLSDLISDLEFREFSEVHLRASFLSFGIFMLFSITGDFVLKEVFAVDLYSLQIFGGLIIMNVSFRYITIGPEANLMFKAKLSDLAPNIALPYMIGPGTLWISIIIGREFDILTGSGIIFAVLATNAAILLTISRAIGHLDALRDTIIGKYFSILMRMNALFVGAIAVEMIITGIADAFAKLK